MAIRAHCDVIIPERENAHSQLIKKKEVKRENVNEFSIKVVGLIELMLRFI